MAGRRKSPAIWRALVFAALAFGCVSTAPAEPSVTIRAVVPEGTGVVYLTGNLDELGPWNPSALAMEGEGRERVAVVRAPVGTRIEYKVTLGSWDREAVGASGAPMPNSVVDVDGDEDTTIVVADFKRGVDAYIEDWQGAGVTGRLDYWRDVTSAHLELSRNVVIWTPPQYEADPRARFPVIYMQDGQNLFDPRIAYAGVDWGVDETIVRLAGEGAIEPAIVVGVWSTTARRFEYAPAGVLAAMSDDVKAMAASEFPEELRTGDAYIRFLAEELKPRVDATYRTRTGPESTFLIGSSMGALISVYGMAERPDVFGGAAGISMHWPVATSEENFLARAQTWRPAISAAFERYFLSKRIDPATHRLWVDHGTGFLDTYYTPYQEAMLPVLRRLGYIEGVSLEARVYPGADHNEAAWRARLHEPLTFLLGRRT